MPANLPAEIFDAVADAILLLNRDRVVTYANLSAERILGVPRLELVGSSWSQRRWRTTLLNGQPLPRDQHSDKKALELGQPTFQMERRIVRPDGSTIYVSGNTVPLLDETGFITGLVVSFADISERVQAEERLRQAHKMEAVGHLAGGIAHDFNNLLTAILGNLSIVLSDWPADAPNKALLSECERAGWCAADLVHRLLTYARRSPPELKPMSLAEAVGRSVALFAPTFPKSIEIVQRHDAAQPPILADAVQVDQVIMNLCMNARDAMPRGGTMWIETAPGDDAHHSVCLRVRDTGVGMTTDVQRRMFEPLFTTKSMGKGTGLGLAMVYSIMQDHNGWIACESAPGVGTCFDVYFPSAQGEQSQSN